MENPRLFTRRSCLWLMSELFETLPEVGDLDKPKLVFFFDEAHLLFNEAPKNCSTRSRGGAARLAQKASESISSRKIHSTSPDKGPGATWQPRATRAAGLHAARSEGGPGGRGNIPAKSEARYGESDTELGKGEALVSFLEGNGTPSMVERALICPPSARLGPVTSAERKAVIAKSPIRGNTTKPSIRNRRTKYCRAVCRDAPAHLRRRRLAGAKALSLRRRPRLLAAAGPTCSEEFLAAVVERPFAPHVDQ